MMIMLGLSKLIDESAESFNKDSPWKEFIKRLQEIERSQLESVSNKLSPKLMSRWAFSQEKFGSKVIEVSDLQGNVNELNLLNLQQKNKILVLKESLRKAEEALVAARSELQEKVTELEQS